MVSLVLLFACAKRKCALPQFDASLSKLPPSDAKSLATEWFARTKALTPTFPARELYKGQSWATYRAVLKECSGSIGYAISAGFGLVPLESQIPSYSVTFADDGDSVADAIVAPETVSRSMKHRLWWSELTRHQDLSCADLAERHPQARFVVIGGKDYIEALHDDLTRLRNRCGRERLFVICSGYSPIKELLADCVLPAKCNFEVSLPGARSGLNARILHWLVTQIVPLTGWNHDAISHQMAAMLASQTAPICATRTSLTEGGVREYLRTCFASEQRGRERPLSAARALRRLRDSGYACEEKRFRRLYQEELVQEMQIALNSDAAGTILPTDVL